MEGRLPAHLEISALIRRAAVDGGFAAVLHKGERDAGTILLVTIEGRNNAQLWERMPQLDGSRKWSVTREKTAENRHEFDDYIARRTARDPDLWVLELDIADPERFVVSVNARS